MKIRTGFVSNSSSSSYVCDVCHDSAVSYDMSLEDAEMFECANGHTVHDKCADLKTQNFLNTCGEEEIEDSAGNLINNPDFNEEGRYEVPAEHCSICQFKVLISNDGLAHLRQKLGINDEDLLKEMKDLYGDYESFKKATKTK
jgi:hypothetical protein